MKQCEIFFKVCTLKTVCFYNSGVLFNTLTKFEAIFILFAGMKIKKQTKGPFVHSTLGNYKFEFLSLFLSLNIMGPKFLKFERDQNAAEKFQIGINKSERL